VPAEVLCAGAGDDGGREMSRVWVRVLMVVAGSVLMGGMLVVREDGGGGWMRNAPAWWYTASVLVAYAVGRRVMLREVAEEMRREAEEERLWRAAQRRPEVKEKEKERDE